MEHWVHFPATFSSIVKAEMSAALQISFAFGYWTHSLEMDEWSGFSWFKPGK